MNITGKLSQVLICFDQESLESALKEMTSSLSFSVKVSSVTDVYPFDGSTQIGFRSFDQKMIVIAHQAIGVNNNGEALHRIF
jgi:hypothetical protein